MQNEELDLLEGETTCFTCAHLQVDNYYGYEENEPMFWCNSNDPNVHADDNGDYEFGSTEDCPGWIENNYHTAKIN